MRSLLSFNSNGRSSFHSRYYDDDDGSISRMPSFSGVVLMRYVSLVIIGICTFFYTKIPLSSGGGGASIAHSTYSLRSSSSSFLQAKFGFIDKAWNGAEEVQFETLIHPSEIDFAIHRRLRVEEERNCDDILLYLPRTTISTSGGGGKTRQLHGHGAFDLNGYLLAALLATYTGKAMVILESPMMEGGATSGTVGTAGTAITPIEAGIVADDSNVANAANWFECPVDTFKNNDDTTPAFVQDMVNANPSSMEEKEDFPTGLSRVIQHPKWLSRGCPVPCQSSYDFSKWNDLRKQHVKQVTCQNDNDRQAVVFAVDGEDARQYFETQWRGHRQQQQQQSAATKSSSSTQQQQSSSNSNSATPSSSSSNPHYSVRAYEWAIRLGAKGHEAATFAKLHKEGDIWDYISALVARSGIVRFQPWIARDVKALIKSSEVPMNWPYTAIYVHRDNNDGPVKDGEQQPSEFIPFYNYLKQWDDIKCSNGGNQAYPVYIATNDPRRIREEIDRLPKDSGGNTILRECHRLKFIFTPVGETLHLLEKDNAKHPCSELHRANIAAIADLIILAKSDTFVGEFGSSFGRLVRIFRTAVNDFPERSRDGQVLVRNTRFAVGSNSQGSSFGGI